MMYSLSLRRLVVPLVLLFTVTVMGTGIDDMIKELVDEKSDLLDYPTKLTQGIIPKPIHSHNDYWRQVPLLTALSFGVTSVEADVWLVEGELFVGHEQAALSPSRTFDKLYVQPLLKIIQAQNPKTKFNTNPTPPNGVWDTASSIPLQLLVDIKTDGVETLPFVIKALEPLRQAGYLSSATGTTLTLGPVLVIGTGNTPLAGIQALDPRDVFLDAPLASLNDTYTPLLSPLASTDWATAVGWTGVGTMSSEQRANLTKFVQDAHSRGIRSRFWDTPGWPISARDAIWREIINAGSDWLNADDVEAASKF